MLVLRVDLARAAKDVAQGHVEADAIQRKRVVELGITGAVGGVHPRWQPRVPCLALPLELLAGEAPEAREPVGEDSREHLVHRT